MKRSRRSEYDKKRNRSKKHSERKLSFAATSKKSDPHTNSKPPKKSNTDSVSNTKKTTSPPSNSIDRLKSFEINENHEKKYQYREIQPKERSGCFNFKLPLIVVAIIAIVRLAMGIANTTSTSSAKDTDAYFKEIIKKAERRTKKLPKYNPAHLIQGFSWPMREVVQLQKDSLFPIVPNVNLRLFKGFHLYDTSLLKTTNVLAKFSKYYFWYDRIEKSPTLSLSKQWENLRNRLINKFTPSIFSHEEVKKYTYKNLNIEERDFKVLYESGELHGVATLVEFEDTRYFFQFISKEKSNTHFRSTYLRKYLDYYLKIR